MFGVRKIMSTRTSNFQGIFVDWDDDKIVVICSSIPADLGKKLGISQGDEVEIRVKSEVQREFSKLLRGYEVLELQIDEPEYPTHDPIIVGIKRLTRCGDR
jgi:hypothetical protein